MTEYITVTAKKRNFTIPAQMPELSDETFTFSEILWDDGTQILWDDGGLILWDDEASFRELKAKKRNFTVVAKVRS